MKKESQEKKEIMKPDKKKKRPEKKKDAAKKRKAVKEIRPKSSRGPRLSTFLVLSITLLSLALLLIYAVFLNYLYKDRNSTHVRENAKKQCERLVLKLSEAENVDADLAFSFGQAADFFNGRVLVLNEDYLIVFDTDEKKTGSYLVNPDVMETMTGAEESRLLEREDYFLIMRRIAHDSTPTGMLILKVSTRELNHLTGGFLQINVAVICVLLLLALGYAVLTSRASVRGLKKVGRAMNTARAGHLDEKLPVKGFREYRELTETYNDTVSDLMALDTTRQEFVSNVSHELKTPITSMKVLADSLIANEDADLAMYKEFMKDIALEIDRESEIITDLLTLVKTDKQSGQINLEEVNINELLEIILKRVAPIAAERDIEVTYESYREVIADVDKVKLSLALTNIIENSVKYNVDGGSVKVSLNADHRNFHIKVSDTGVGIPEDCKEKVFERFYRVDKARSRDTGGTGLGLAITKNVINMHHGTIKLYSESGQGTTFTIRIPIRYTEMETDD